MYAGKYGIILRLHLETYTLSIVYWIYINVRNQVCIMKRFFAIFLLLFSSLFILNPLCALAASADAPLFQTEITDTAKKAGDTFSVTLSPKRDVAAFIMDLQYDAAVITEVRAELTGTAKKDFLTFSDENGTAVLA